MYFRVRGSRGHSFTNVAPARWGLGVQGRPVQNSTSKPSAQCPTYVLIYTRLLLCSQHPHKACSGQVLEGWAGVLRWAWSLGSGVAGLALSVDLPGPGRGSGGPLSAHQYVKDALDAIEIERFKGPATDGRALFAGLQEGGCRPSCTKPQEPSRVVLPATTPPKLFGGRGYGGASPLSTQQ